jgi:hypothetical protein
MVTYDSRRTAGPGQEHIDNPEPFVFVLADRLGHLRQLRVLEQGDFLIV